MKLTTVNQAKKFLSEVLDAYSRCEKIERTFNVEGSRVEMVVKDNLAFIYDIEKNEVDVCRVRDWECNLFLTHMAYNLTRISLAYELIKDIKSFLK